MPTIWIKDKKEQEKIINQCDSCTMAMVDEKGKPYAVIMNFGYNDGILYLHGDAKGRKMDILRNNSNVCITMSTGHELYHQNKGVACSYGMNYKSIIAKGVIEFVKDYDEKVNAMNIIMRHYTDSEFKFNEPSIKQICVFKIKLENITAKNFGRFVR